MNAVFEGAPEGAPDTRLGRNTGYTSDLPKGSFQNCSQGLYLWDMGLTNQHRIPFSSFRHIQVAA